MSEPENTPTQAHEPSTDVPPNEVAKQVAANPGATVTVGVPDFVGKFVCCDDVCITASTDGSHYSRSITGPVAVTIDGKKAELTDLKHGDAVTLVGDPVMAVKVTRDKPKAA